MAAEYARRRGAEPTGVWSAPGRVNLIGEHTDYNGGLCLPVPLPHRTYVAARALPDRTLRFGSAQSADEWSGHLDDVRAGHPSGWAAYAAGVPWAMARAGLPVTGLDALVDGHVPLGSGLSSSAALECAVARAVVGLCDADDRVAAAALVEACVQAENVVAQAPTGGMDQAAALLGSPGHALLLDCRSGATRQVPLDLAAAGLALLVIDTRAPHRLVDGQYAERRATCERAARALGVTTLREVDDLDAALAALPDALTRARVRHVVTEIGRVTEVARVLDAGRPAQAGPVLDASHASLRDDYEVSCTELDLAVDAAREAGALGARMTGGGFGGSAVALVEAAAVEHVAAHTARRFAGAGLGAPAFLRLD